uniref:Uncharacterized protein n=1 Tax=Loa loa TaxID=7209 RepID=A0A1I7VE97_LOALO
MLGYAISPHHTPRFPKTPPQPSMCEVISHHTSKDYSNIRNMPHQVRIIPDYGIVITIRRGDY